MKQLRSEIPNLKHKLLSSEPTKKKKKLKQIKSKFFSRKIWAKAIKTFQWYVVKKLRNLIYILLECLLPYTHPIIYPKCIGSGIQNTGKPNELLSVMTV